MVLVRVVPGLFWLLAIGVHVSGIPPTRLALHHQTLSFSTAGRVLSYPLVHLSWPHLLSNLVVGVILLQWGVRHDHPFGALASGGAAGAIGGAVAFLMVGSFAGTWLAGSSAVLTGQIGFVVAAKASAGRALTWPWMVGLLGSLMATGSMTTLVAHLGGLAGGAAVGWSRPGDGHVG